VVALTSTVLLTLLFISYYNFRPNLESLSQPQIEPSPPQVAPQPHTQPKPDPKPKPNPKPKPEAQHEPEVQFGADIDPDHCSPTALPYTDAQPSSGGPDDIIPNIVHYVWLLNGRETFSVNFKVFISVYSAHLYFQPDIIYIHTDASPEQWEKAKSSGNEATRWMLSIPNLSHHWVKPPKYTLTCREITRIEHVSDFVRTQQLHHYGGMYLDTDILALRDVRKLRESGFSNIVGIEDPDKVNNGFMMSKPGSAMLSVFMSEQHRVFDNQWLTHSVELLSKVAFRLQAVPGEVLILGIKAFAPSSWRLDAVEALFNPHNETEASIPSDKKDALPKIPTGFKDAVDYWSHREWKEKAEWEIDYSASYVIHAFEGIVDTYWTEKVDLEYVVARQSNYARAVYPAIKHAIDVGIIDRKAKAGAA
jgi:hypothetical protein